VAISVPILGTVALAGAAVVQSGDLRITALAQVQPYRLPRTGTAPIAVFLSGHIASTSGAVPPQLQQMTVKVNRHGRLQARGLPTCTLAELQPGSSGRALSNCADALVGSGRFWASIVLPDQRPYHTRGRLLVFNGKKGGKPVLFAHIYTTKPFATSFVVTFAIKHIHQDRWGTELTASLPQALGSWGFVDRIKLTLRREYRTHGERRGYFNAGCPALPGAQVTTFPLAQVSFYFAATKKISLDIDKSCGVSG